jgi:hypothetical protein
MFRHRCAILRDFLYKGIQPQHLNLSITLPVLEYLKC